MIQLHRSHIGKPVVRDLTKAEEQFIDAIAQSLPLINRQTRTFHPYNVYDFIVEVAKQGGTTRDIDPVVVTNHLLAIRI